MPSTPIIVNGTITQSNGSNADKALVHFNVSSGATELYETSNDGKYLVDLANIGVSSGDSVSYSVRDEYNNETYSGSFIAVNTKTINITLEVRSDVVTVPGNRDTQIYNIGGKIVSQVNPLPVIVSKIPIDEGRLTISYDSSNNPITLVKTLGSNVYTRTISYDSSNNPIKVSQWVRS